jgi:hypothetical protein
MRMGPIGHILVLAYKFLCQACYSLVPITQMNACASAGNNSWKMMIPMLVKTFNIGTGKAKGLFNHVVRGMANEINAEKLNCAKERRIHQKTYQKLDLWFNSWEVFVVKYEFATTSQIRELLFHENVKKRILNRMRHSCPLTGAAAIAADIQL